MNGSVVFVSGGVAGANEHPIRDFTEPSGKSSASEQIVVMAGARK
jgi:hypothetical protein